MMKSIATILVLATAVTAHAESLEEKKYWDGEMRYVKRYLADAEKVCGTTFTIEFVDKEKLREADDKKRHSPSGIANHVINQVDLLCRAGDAEQAAVKGKIKGIVIGSANPRTLTLSKGILTYKGNMDQANASDFIKPELQKKL